MKFLTILALLLAVFVQIGQTEEVEELDEFGEKILQADSSDEQGWVCICW